MTFAVLTSIPIFQGDGCGPNHTYQHFRTKSNHRRYLSSCIWRLLHSVRQTRRGEFFTPRHQAVPLRSFFIHQSNPNRFQQNWFLFFQVWLSLAILTAGVRAVIILTHILDQKINNNFNEGLQISYATITNSQSFIKQRFDESINFSGIFTDAGVDRHRYLLKFLLLGTWGLMMTIVYNAYTTTITSFLTIPRLKPLPDNLEELAKEPSFKLTLEWDHLKTQTFLVTPHNSIDTQNWFPFGQMIAERNVRTDEETRRLASSKQAFVNQNVCGSYGQCFEKRKRFHRRKNKQYQ